MRVTGYTINGLYGIFMSIFLPGPRSSDEQAADAEDPPNERRRVRAGRPQRPRPQLRVQRQRLRLRQVCH